MIKTALKKIKIDNNTAILIISICLLLLTGLLGLSVKRILFVMFAYFALAFKVDIRFYTKAATYLLIVTPLLMFVKRDDLARDTSILFAALLMLIFVLKLKTIKE